MGNMGLAIHQVTRFQIKEILNKWTEYNKWVN